MSKISVIVPCYNAISYLDKCLESLISQTMFKDLDIILIDDCSTDNTKEILSKYIKKYKNMRSLFLKKNGGLGNARNEGLKLSESEYVYFIDSDDYIDKETLEKCYIKAIKDKSDIVEFDFIWEYPNKSIIDSRTHYKGSKEMLKQVRVMACNKIYNTKFLKDINPKFAVGLKYEDILFTYQYVPYVNKVSYINKAFYHYVQRDNSLSNHQNERVREIYTVLEEVYDYYKNKNIFDKYYSELEYNFIRILLGSSYKRAVNIPDKKVRNEILEEGWIFLNTKFPNWKKNIYLKGKSKKNMYFRYMNKTLYNLNKMFFRK